jgi:hypothetical protein
MADDLSAVPDLGSDLDAARARVVAQGLTGKAFALLTPLITELGLSLEALGPVKQLRKRFFSDAPWTRDDDEALADAIGPGTDGRFTDELEPGLGLEPELDHPLTCFLEHGLRDVARPASAVPDHPSPGLHPEEPATDRRRKGLSHLGIGPSVGSSERLRGGGKRGFASKRGAAQALRAHQVQADAEPIGSDSEDLTTFVKSYVGGLDGRAPSTLLSYQDMVEVQSRRTRWVQNP